MKRIGMICLALVLALGALGVAYAPWTDEVEITQTVETGELEVGVSGEAYLHRDDKEVASVEVTFGEFKFSKDTDPPYPDEYYESVTVTVGNLYPGVRVFEDFYITVGGTIPVKLMLDWDVDDPDGVYDHMGFRCTVLRNPWVGGPTLYKGDDPCEAAAVLEGLQVYPCETIVISLNKYLEQSAPHGASASATLTVTAIQYNEYVEP